VLKVFILFIVFVPAYGSVQISKKALAKLRHPHSTQGGGFSTFGSADGGGVDLELMMGKDSWFIQDRDDAPKSVRYCIETNIENSNLNLNKIEVIFNRTLEQWFAYIKKHKIENMFQQVPIYVKNYERVDQCESKTDLRIVYGEPNQTVKEILNDEEWQGMKLAHAKAIEDKRNEFEKKAVIWISGRLNNQSLSDEEVMFEALLKHEFGHSLGVKHTPATLMSNALGIALLFRGFVTEDHLRFIVSKLEMGGSLVGLTEPERLFGEQESKGSFGFVNDSGQNQEMFYKLTGEKISKGTKIQSIVKSSSAGSRMKEWVLKSGDKEYSFLITLVPGAKLRVDSMSLALFNFSRQFTQADGEEGHAGAPYPNPEIDLVKIQQNFGKDKVFFGEVLNGVVLEEEFGFDFKQNIELVENAQLVMKSAFGQFPLHRVYKIFPSKKEESAECLNFYCLGVLDK
tara:strand:- start:5875 stop:7242 length:1368 start_codon:yes stop_codon:yes gene_type:complete